ncbi:Forkhead box protein J2, partial [Lunasporangiospora selenospora]
MPFPGAPAFTPSLPPPQGYVQHDPTYYPQQQQPPPHSYQTSQPPPQQQQQQQQPQQQSSYGYPFGYSSGPAMTPSSSSSYSSPTHIHTSLSTSSSPVSSTSQSLSSISALLSPRSDFGHDPGSYFPPSQLSQPQQPSYYSYGSSTGTGAGAGPGPGGITSTKDGQSPRGDKKPSRLTLSSTTHPMGLGNFATSPAASSAMNAPSIHSIASAQVTNTKMGTTAISANLSPPSLSTTSPPLSSTSPPPTLPMPKKKMGMGAGTGAGGSAGKKSPPMQPSSSGSEQSKFQKPTLSYSYLITTAIQTSPNQQLTLNEIYEWAMEHYPWYRTAINGWK